MPGLVDSLKDVLGARAKPTAIQALAMRWLLKPFSEPAESTFTANLDAESTSEVNGEVEAEPGNEAEAEATENTQGYRQFLLASETGSGKSIAYFLPLLQSLKQSELSSSSSTQLPHDSRRPPAPLNPRALILAPTHELSRQLASFGKGLIHNIKLRVMSASRANVPNDGRSSSSSHSSSQSSELSMRAGTGGRNMSASRMAKAWDGENEEGEFEVNGSSVRGKGRDVDVLVGTPKRLLEMVMGHGWDREARRNAEAATAERGGRKWVVGPREVGLEGVEWVVVDEADTLLDSDFKQETTRLLSEIAAARGYTVPPSPPASTTTTTTTSTPSSTLPHAYPFNFILTSATIPTSLSTYLSTYHPTLTRLASPRLHRFPTNLRIEHHPYTTGNPYADIERKIKFIWAQQALEGSGASVNGGTKGKKTKMVIFRQKKTQAVELGKFLRERGFKVVVVTGGGGNVSVEDAGRAYGSNRHIQPFLNPARSSSSSSSSRAPEPARKEKEENEDEPRILISTSLLARGLDFAPEVTHVLMVDPTRNTADFLHRAGRTARAGREGTVVLFAKEGRGSERGRELRKRVEELRKRK
ncbi:P-loop containing nucleoside triphosphate hydrolase protein [Stereum hirsutum FP-91666 SS1]|uniref:P-loop containing nucleoside triphosphate hydrolase protein n=1 Tax=Stereum hirsutum (strain FP-91666) TaxID=721885 RepID=UPI000440F2CB|nr:P-loop containing nucleoside triphosphate hydrolase protein [Stereum hirsutum FP-91666 SS1]EIM91737.1 P-loop containing nucleoside triphosphate hydrolase protein [Stereum hirsutum FP-91666 SS1]